MSTAALQATAREWLARGEPAIEVRVAEARGSAPREAGARMLVAARRVAGTVGGGHLELQAIQIARDMLAAGETLPREKHFPLGPALGQCCGGAVTLAFEPLTDAVMANWPAPKPRFHLQLYGAGHVGRAIVHLLSGIDCKVQWIDERDEEFPEGPLPPHIEKVCVDAVEGEVDMAEPGTFYLVLTHNHDLDMRITEAVLRRGDFGFLGLIGSQTKRARFLHRFEARGIRAETLSRMTCPIGIPGIEGKEPEVLAISVAGQLLQAASGK